MKLVTIFVTTLVMALGLVADMAARTQAPPAAAGAEAPPPAATPPGPLPGEGALAGQPVILDLTQPKSDKPIVLDIVEVVGCVADGPNSTVIITNGSQALKGGVSAQTTQGLKAAADRPLGTNQYVLIGASEWNPAGHKGHKVVVKGLLIKDAKEMRLNVTSFNMVGATCTK